jgi:hypothetical protein
MEENIGRKEEERERNVKWHYLTCFKWFGEQVRFQWRLGNEKFLLSTAEKETETAEEHCFCWTYLS